MLFFGGDQNRRSPLSTVCTPNLSKVLPNAVGIAMAHLFQLLHCMGPVEFQPCRSSQPRNCGKTGSLNHKQKWSQGACCWWKWSSEVGKILARVIVPCSFLRRRSKSNCCRCWRGWKQRVGPYVGHVTHSGPLHPKDTSLKARFKIQGSSINSLSPLSSPSFKEIFFAFTVFPEELVVVCFDHHLHYLNEFQTPSSQTTSDIRQTNILKTPHVFAHILGHKLDSQTFLTRTSKL